MESHEIAARKSLDVMIELYRKNVWNDAKTVNVIATACFSSYAKIMVTALKFFLETYENRQEAEEEAADAGYDESSFKYSSSTDPGTIYKELLHSRKTGKKTKKKERQIRKALNVIQRKEHAKQSSENSNFSALHLLNDPQTFAEKLFGKLKQPNEKYEAKIILMNLISRLIGTHQLVLLNFYSFLLKYLSPRTKEVTLILAYTAQASHDLVPPDVMEPVLRTIANNFISDHCSNEAIVVGLNAIREISKRCPLAMTAALLQDLSEYKSFKDKAVMMSARSLIGLFRMKNPKLLLKKDRGKEAQQNLKNIIVREYGQKDVAKQIEGVEYMNNSSEPEENVFSISESSGMHRTSLKPDFHQENDQPDGSSELSDCTDLEWVSNEDELGQMIDQNDDGVFNKLNHLEHLSEPEDDGDDITDERHKDNQLCDPSVDCRKNDIDFLSNLHTQDHSTRPTLSQDALKVLSGRC